MMIRANSAALLHALIDSGLTATAAARRCKINRALFNSLLACNKTVSIKTAGKLKRQFGATLSVLRNPRRAKSSNQHVTATTLQKILNTEEYFNEKEKKKSILRRRDVCSRL